jgi:MSHA biogenesis protein MshP
MNGARGFTLVSAIFLMVVLVILSVSLVTISSVQHTTAAQQLQSLRATFAARTGAEWAAARAQAQPDCALWPSPATLTLGGTLAGFTVTVTCARSDHMLGSATQAYYVVDIAAQGGQYGSVDFVQRRVQTKVLGP